MNPLLLTGAALAATSLAGFLMGSRASAREDRRTLIGINAVLRTLVDNGPLYGLDLIRATNGTLVKRTAYLTLSRMEEAGLIEGMLVDTEHGPRRQYTITKTGADAHRSTTQRVLHTKPGTTP